MDESGTEMMSLPKLPEVSDGGSVGEEAAAGRSGEGEDEGRGTRRPCYTGGFSTSINALFRDSRRRTDCCAVACCGILASDRSRYLLTGERPSWRRRICFNIVVLPLGVIVGAFIIAATAADDQDDDALVVPYALLALVAMGWIVYLSVRAGKIRFQFRQDLMRHMYIERTPSEAGGEVNEAALGRFLKRHEHHSRRAQFFCCCGYGHDWSEGVDVEDDAGVRDDLCSCIWNAFSCLCWGYFCGNWLQCCGICGVAQEEREVKELVPRAQQMIDFVTFQPFAEYFQGIEDLRLAGNNSVVAHFRSLSRLSVKLLKVLAAFILVLGLFALTDIDSNFTIENMLVLLATFCQAFLVLHLVHWRWHKMDLSLDAVVKYFACGFLLTTFLAIFIEQAVAVLIQIVVLILFIVAGAEDLSSGIDFDALMKDFVKMHEGLFIFYFFLASFVMAALVEELSKYFGFWMIEHPDFFLAEEVVDASPSSALESNGEDEFAIEDVREPAEPIAQRKTLNCVGSGITIGMVSVALGFACCENLIYVFIATPPSVGAEISTLLLRSLFPIHPLSAAIQSIGVCRRELEGDKSYQVGRIIFPAILLHGTFDFVLMVVTFFTTVDQIDDVEETFGEEVDLNQQYWDSLKAQIPALIVGMVLFVLGAVYYMVQSNAQRRRLAALEESRLSASIDRRGLLS